MHWRRKWQPTPVFLPGESQGRGSLVGCCQWGHTVGHDWSDLAAAIYLLYVYLHICVSLRISIAFSSCVVFSWNTFAVNLVLFLTFIFPLNSMFLGYIYSAAIWKSSSFLQITASTLSLCSLQVTSNSFLQTFCQHKQGCNEPSLACPCVCLSKSVSLILLHCW